MPRDSSGVYTLPAGYEAVADTTIQPAQHNTPLEDLAQAVTDSLPRNGAAAMTGDLNAGGNQITNLGAPAAGTDALSRDAGDARYLQAADFTTSRNLLINPDMLIDQRNGNSTLDFADDAYFCDRWYALTQTAAVTRATAVAYINRPVITIKNKTGLAAQRLGVAQIVEHENCRDCIGGSVTISGNVKSAVASFDVRYAILGWSGTSDAVTSDVVNN